MILAILASAAALAAPLPEGRGGSRLIPLAVTSEPSGAEAFVRYRDGAGQEQRQSCTTPCTLMIPRASPFVFQATKDGRPMIAPPFNWTFKGAGFGGPNLPAEVRATLPPS